MVIDVGGASSTVSIVQRSRDTKVVDELQESAKASFQSPHRSTSLLILSSSSTNKFGGAALDDELGTDIFFHLNLATPTRLHCNRRCKNYIFSVFQHRSIYKQQEPLVMQSSKIMSRSV